MKLTENDQMCMNYLAFFLCNLEHRISKECDKEFLEKYKKLVVAEFNKKSHKKLREDEIDGIWAILHGMNGGFI